MLVEGSLDLISVPRRTSHWAIVSENELRRESKTHSYLSCLENQLSYICDARIVCCRVKTSRLLQTCLTSATALIAPQTSSSLAVAAVQPIWGKLKKMPREPWSRHHFGFSARNDACLARSCSSRITQARPAVTCGGGGAAALRRAISENYTRLRKRGDDADAPFSRSFSDCRSRTRRLAPKYREDYGHCRVFWIGPPMPPRPSLRCVDGVSTSHAPSRRARPC